MLHDRNLFNLIDSSIESYEFTGIKERDAFEIIRNFYIDTDLENIEKQILDSCLISRDYLSELMSVNIDLKNSIDIIKELIKTIRHYNLEDRRDKLLEKIKSLDNQNRKFDMQELNSLIDELNEINLKLNLPS
ncbi:hypothetical protein HMPREF9129_1332 [Peptoniphilus indolicus ATCC 29427]|uniref:DNA primase n=2 Tax=Peptoniphilus indolicus TaxID=33030 RepID=G4D4K2_9FIRM|nr:hypothetical protein [Peptoniphilus indolicus]EGY79549.1 hypothetical protein HMPREF9129_1332 [Peptoniphilus indolicus ATCC 29427]